MRHSTQRYIHLRLSDVAVDDNQRPSLLQVTIKMDPFQKGVVICVGCTGTQLCPVAAQLDYICSRGTAPGPLFVFDDGRLLTRSRYVERVRDSLSKVGVDQPKLASE
jgi:hypothetical protein